MSAIEGADANSYFLDRYTSDEEVPYIPDDLITEFYRGNVVAFLGSGVSAWAKDVNGRRSPLWEEILLNIINEAAKKGLISNQLRISELKALVGYGSSGHSIDDMLIAANYVVNKFDINNEDLSGFIYNLLEKYNYTPVINKISNLPFRGFVTTNYDKLIEDSYATRGKI